MSFNSLFGLGTHSEDANLEGWWPLQDSAASTAVDDVSSNANDGALEGGPNTADISITGPNSYLTNALDLDGTDDNILLPDVAALKTNEFTVLGFCKPTTGSNPVWGWGPTYTSYPGVYAEWGSGRAIVYLGASNYRIYNNTTNADDGSWHHVGFGSPGGANTDINNCVFMIDGVEPTIDSTLSSGAIATKNRPRIGRTRSADAFDGPIAGVAYFSRLLSDAEIGEHESGPEPINSVAPVVSGTETVGASLSCTSGTWGLDAPFSGGSNGTITYTYQWTRSDDGTGTNEADISGATSSSYTLVAGDLAKYIRCRVAATNDGGHDSSADTNSNFTGAISGGGGGGFQAAWATIARRNSIIGGGV